MARSISEFIQEQESVAVNDNNMSDSLEKVYVESMIAFSTAQCVLEHAALVDFASECGISNIAVLQEAGDSTEEKKTNIFKKAGSAIANAWKWFVGILKGIWKKIRGFFKNKQVDDAAKKYESIFEQFKEKYPEVTDDISAGDFYDFLKNKYPNLAAGISAEDLTALAKYEALSTAVDETNKLLDTWIEKTKDLKLPVLDTNKTKKFVGSVKLAYHQGNSDANNTTEDNAKDAKMGDIMERVSRIKTMKTSLSELCAEGERKLNTLEENLKKTAEEQLKKTSNDAGYLGNPETGANNNKSVQENKQTMEYLRQWVNTLTKLEVDVTKGCDKAIAFINKIGNEKLAELQEKGEIAESFYFV